MKGAGSNLLLWMFHQACQFVTWRRMPLFLFDENYTLQKKFKLKIRRNM